MSRPSQSPSRSAATTPLIIRRFWSTVLAAALALTMLGVAAPASTAAPAGYDGAGYFAFADRRQADVEPLWSERFRRYVPAVGVMDTRLNANMLTVHAIAALAGHEGASRHDERIGSLVSALVAYPAYVEQRDQIGSTVAGDQPHAPGWMPSTLYLSHPQHVSLDPKVAEALAYAYRARDRVGLDPALSARVVQEVHAVANSPFYRYPAIRLNQFNWHADLYVLDAQLSGNTAILAQYRAQLARFVAGIRRPLTAGGSTNLNDGLGLHYLPNLPADCAANRVSTSEYANMIFSGLMHYDWALAEGMAPLSRADESLLRAWGERVMFGEWTHAGYLNWDSGLGFDRWHLERYWAFATYGLDTLATEQRLAFSARQHAWAKALVDSGLDTYERWAAQSAGGMLPWAMFGIHCSIGSPGTDSQLIASRFAAHAARDALLGLGGIAAERPPAFYASDPQVQRLAVSTPHYATAITGAHPSAHYGGLELARLYNAQGYPVSGTGGSGRVAFGLAFASGGCTRSDTQPGSDDRLAAATRLRTSADARGGRLRGTFRGRLIARSGLVNEYAAIAVTHQFTPRAVTTTHRIRARRSGTVTLRFPVFGDHSSVSVGRAGGRLRTLTLTAEHGGYIVTFLRLPADAQMRVITCACQASAPHTHRVAQVSFPLRRRQATIVTVRLVTR